MKLFVYKQSGKLTPCTSDDKEKMGKLPKGEPFMVSYEKQRNPKLLAKYWVLMHFAFKNLPENYDGYWTVVDDMEEEILKAIGWKKVTRDFKGNEVVKAKSISYKECSEEHFEQIYNRALDLIFRMIDVEDQSEEMKRLLEFA